MSSDRRAAPSQAADEPDAHGRWEQAQEVRALRDTLSIYRRCVTDFAAENAMLREQLEIMRLIAAPSGPPEWRPQFDG